MASITIRNLDEGVKRKLRLRAAHRNRSMEEEAREIQRTALAQEPARVGNLADAIRGRVELLGVLSLRCRRGDQFASSPISHDHSRHERLVRGVASCPIGRSAGMDAIGARFVAVHDADHRVGDAIGIALLPEGRRRRSLQSVVNLIFAEDLAGRVLPFDSAAAREFADIAATPRRIRQPLSEADARIAAIARSRGAALATRNAADFENCRLVAINPWT